MASGKTISFVDPALTALSGNVRLKSLASLHLSRRALNALRAIGIKTVGDLIDRGRLGIPPFRAAGMLMVKEINAAVTALSKNVKKGDIDWIGYATDRRFTLLPPPEGSQWSPQDFLKEFPRVAEAAVRSRYGEQAIIVLNERILGPLRPTSLKEIGKRLGGKTKQGVSLIERRVIKMFQHIFREDEYRGCKFRLRPEFVQPMKTLMQGIKPEWERVVSFSEWEHVLMKLWRARPDDLGVAQRLILEILGAQPFVFVTLNSRPVIFPQRNRQAIRRVLKEIQSLLTRRYPNGLTPTDLHSKLQKKFGARMFKFSSLAAFVKSMPDLEMVEGRYRARRGSLKTFVDEYERVLREAGRPMHFREIWSKVHGDAPNQVTPRNVAHNIHQYKDKRFAPISRSGFWALAEWRDIERRSVADIAEFLLAKFKRPMRQVELFKRISKMRPVLYREMGTLLGHGDRFRKTAPLTWTLAKSKTRGSESVSKRKK